jgi:hypothetical protein
VAQTENKIWDDGETSLYVSFMEKWSMPSKWVVQSAWGADAFRQKANAYYQDFLNSKIWSAWWQITNMQLAKEAFKTKGSNWLNADMKKINSVLQVLNQYEQDIVDWWLSWKLGVTIWNQTIWTDASKKIKQSESSLLTKLKELENLWVLNWPDVGILQKAIWWWTLTTPEQMVNGAQNLRNSLYNQLNAQNKVNWIVFNNPWNTYTPKKEEQQTTKETQPVTKEKQKPTETNKQAKTKEIYSLFWIN